MHLKLPISYHNMVSYTGTFLIIISLCAFIFVYILSSLAPTENPYVGLILFLVLPVPFIIGLLLVPVGMLIRHRRGHGLQEKVSPLPILNFNETRHKIAFLIFTIGGLFFGTFTIYVLYEAYHFTETTTFCGEVCHQVMEPEFVTYINSPHARVSCAECHVGAGADFYVKSKLSGSYQVYATLINEYPKPIPTPIANLRPARETCEQCHWPEKFFDSQHIINYHYLSDEENTQWTVNLLTKIGGGTIQSHAPSGSHWHVHPENKVEYIATDDKRQNIPWIRYTNTRTNEVKEFLSEMETFDPDSLDNYEIRTIDCMDCHNRPTHIFRTPNKAVNLALASGEIDRTLPYIKLTAVEALVEEYESTDAAMDGIADYVRTFYQDDYPETAAEKSDKLDQAIHTLQTIYKENFFPSMNSRWDVYPDNIGHLNFPGCYRCHDGMHITESGDTITGECTTCHDFLAIGTEEEMAVSQGLNALEFKHPVDIGEAWKEMGCYECHTGSIP